MVASGTSISLSTPDLTGNREVHYTLDGTDPRPRTSNAVISGDSLLTEEAAVRVIVPTSDIGSAWREDLDFDDSSWIAGSNGVGYDDNTEYDPYISVNLEGAQAMKAVNTSAYVRLAFSVNAEDLAMYNYLALQMRYDDGFVAYLNGTRIAAANEPGTLTWDAAAVNTHDDGAAVSFQTIEVSRWLGSLKAGQNLLAIHGLNAGSTSSDFLIQAKIVAGIKEEGAGGMSEANIYTGPITLTESVELVARLYDPAGANSVNSAVKPVGSPWSPPLKVRYLIDEEPATPDNLAITELMVDPPDFSIPGFENDGRAFEYIELALLDENHFNPSPGDPANFALSSLGESLWLLAADEEGSFTGEFHSVTFGASPVNRSQGRYVDPSGIEHFLLLETTTPGSENAPPLVGPLVFTEVHYDSAQGLAEFVEILNLSDTPVSLDGTRVNGIGYTFPAGSGFFLAPHQLALVVAAEPDEFRAARDVPSHVPIFGPFTAKLNNAGDPQHR